MTAEINPETKKKYIYLQSSNKFKTKGGVVGHTHI